MGARGGGGRGGAKVPPLPVCWNRSGLRICGMVGPGMMVRSLNEAGMEGGRVLAGGRQLLLLLMAADARTRLASKSAAMPSWLGAMLPRLAGVGVRSRSLWSGSLELRRERWFWSSDTNDI